MRASARFIDCPAQITACSVEQWLRHPAAVLPSPRPPTAIIQIHTQAFVIYWMTIISSRDCTSAAKTQILERF
jgi:hypothetical protein